MGRLWHILVFLSVDFDESCGVVALLIRTNDLGSEGERSDSSVLLDCG